MCASSAFLREYSVATSRKPETKISLSVCSASANSAMTPDMKYTISFMAKIRTYTVKVSLRLRMSPDSFIGLAPGCRMRIANRSALLYLVSLSGNHLVELRGWAAVEQTTSQQESTP